MATVQFREADLDNALTAAAAGPIRGDERKAFRKFQLLKDHDHKPAEVTL